MRKASPFFQAAPWGWLWPPVAHSKEREGSYLDPLLSPAGRCPRPETNPCSEPFAFRIEFLADSHLAPPQNPVGWDTRGFKAFPIACNTACWLRSGTPLPPPPTGLGERGVPSASGHPLAMNSSPPPSSIPHRPFPIVCHTGCCQPFSTPPPTGPGVGWGPFRPPDTPRP